LSKLNSDWGWLVSNEILEVTNSDVLTKKRILSLSKLDGDWSWLVSDEILEITNGNVLTKKRI
jgi:hypothetical protein